MLFRFIALVLLFACVGSSAQDLGYSRLQADWGDELPLGSGIRVTQIEAFESAQAYAVDASDPRWKTIDVTDASGSSTEVSGHATRVGLLWYGATTGIAPGLDAVDIYQSNHWLGDGFLRTGSSRNGPPRVEDNHIQCHSWIGRLSPDASLVGAVDALRRFDYAIERDGFVAVVSLDNGAESDVPDLLAHAYNAIVVGRADGRHSQGTTRYEGIGRTRPDLVGPLPATSLNVPLVGGAASLLLELANRNPALHDAEHPAVIKAMLMAGTTRDNLEGWSTTPKRPLDPTYGAGLLNLFNSVQILSFGQQSEDWLQPLGWDLGSLEDDTHTYDFVIPERGKLLDVTVVLHWQRSILDVDPGPDFIPEPELADLDLSLVRVGSDHRTELAISQSSVDNVEMIHLPVLDPGAYELRVTARGATTYGLAWHSQPLVEAE